jgi:hypothetical protein
VQFLLATLLRKECHGSLLRRTMMPDDLASPDAVDPGPPGGIHNAYPDLPVLNYVHTTVAMQDVVTLIGQSASTIAIKRASYVLLHNESTGGQNGINNNYIGLQADGDRHAPKYTSFFSGTCLHRENMTGNWRRFICFKSWQGCVQVLCGMVDDRGLYVGGYANPYANMQINTVDQWPLGYYREWVEGSETVDIPPNDKADLLKQYQTAISLFPSPGIFQSLQNFGRRIFSAT